MRKVQHKDMVQFIGACTRLPNLCIEADFFLVIVSMIIFTNINFVFKIPAPLKVAIGVSKSMNYLHQNPLEGTL